MTVLVCLIPFALLLTAFEYWRHLRRAESRANAKQREEAKPEEDVTWPPEAKPVDVSMCGGPLCHGHRNSVRLRGSYCAECNAAISDEHRNKKFRPLQ
jgi:hypothetical protein